MWKKFVSSCTVWLGVVVELLGNTLDVLSSWGIDGVKQQIQDAGYDPATFTATLKVLGPLIIIARLRSLVKK